MHTWLFLDMDQTKRQKALVQGSQFAEEPDACAQRSSSNHWRVRVEFGRLKVGGGVACGYWGWAHGTGHPSPAGEPEAQPLHSTDSLDSSSGALATGPAGFWCVTRGEVSSSDLELGTASTFTSFSSCPPFLLVF